MSRDAPPASPGAVPPASGRTTPPTSPRPARARLLEAAARLFYADGITATGIDRVTAEAGVARKSLYNNFSSKEDLVLAVIEGRHEEWRELHRQRAQAAATAHEAVLAVFDAYLDHAESVHRHPFRGCGLLNAAAELPAGSPGREAIRRHKEEVEQLLAEALHQITPGRAAEETAEHLAFLLEGAVSRAGLDGDPARLRRARRIAEQMVAAR